MVFSAGVCARVHAGQQCCWSCTTPSSWWAPAQATGFLSGSLVPLDGTTPGLFPGPCSSTLNTRGVMSCRLPAAARQSRPASDMFERAAPAGRARSPCSRACLRTLMSQRHSACIHCSTAPAACCIQGAELQDEFRWKSRVAAHAPGNSAAESIRRSAGAAMRSVETRAHRHQAWGTGPVKSGRLVRKVSSLSDLHRPSPSRVNGRLYCRTGSTVAPV